MRLIKSFSDLRRCKRGNVMVLAAATAPLLIAAPAIAPTRGFSGLVVRLVG